MPKAEIKGLEEFEKTLTHLGADINKITDKALYEGAGIMADEVKNRIEAMSAVDERTNIIAYYKGEKQRLSKNQKQGLLKGLGIAPFVYTPNYKDTKIGFDGYNDIKTKKYPNGQPNQLIARVLESGSSYMDKKPFMRIALTKGKKRVEDKMKEIIENEINKITKE